jgi:putative IMPACT (imprinted ancient) family translation regulator
MAAIQFDIDYGQLQSLEYQLKKVNGQIVEQNFTDKVTVIIHLPESAVDGIVKQFVPQY